MTSRRKFLTNSFWAAAMLSTNLSAKAANGLIGNEFLVSCRPKLNKRTFHSKAVEELIQEVKKVIKDDELAWMFEKLLPKYIGYHC